MSPCRTAIVAACFLLPVVPVGGCSSSPPPQTGSFNAVTRELEATIDAPLDRAFAAAEKAVKAMKFATTSARSDVLQGVVRARMADATSVDIDLRKVTDGTTLVSIKVGTLGDASVSRTVLDELKKGL